MLCLDDYFMIEVEKIEKDPETGKKVKKKVSIMVVRQILFRLILYKFFFT